MFYLKERLHMKRINSYRSIIEKNKFNSELINSCLENLYTYMKEIAPYYQKQGTINSTYKDYVNKLYQIEENIPISFIIDNKLNLNPPKNIPFSENNKSNYSEKDYLDYIAYTVRKHLISNGSGKNNLSELNLRGFCLAASHEVKELSESLGLSCQIYLISPAFYKKRNLYEKGNCHFFALVKIKEKEYIVDLTYSQFFQLAGNNLNRIGIPFLGGTYAGSYMILTEERKHFAENLLSDGYVEANNENIKLYFDGFALSYRNGLYYEDAGEINYNTTYTSEDYRNFIDGLDSQINHENIEYLGRQHGVLTNPGLNFQQKRAV